MELAGPLYRRTPRLFSPNKPGDWSLVWCELALEEGELVVSLDRDGSSRVATIRLKDCDLAHVRSDGRDCFEVAVSRAKKETFSSHESSHDVDWWMSMLVSVKRDLELGIKPRVPIVCMPAASEASASYKSSRRLHSTSLGTADAMNRLSDSAHSPGSPGDTQRAFRRRQPSLITSMALLERFTIYETPTMYYVVCSDRHYSRFRLLELNRTIERPTQLNQVLTEDTNVYSWEEMEAKLQNVAETTRVSGTGLLTRAFTAVAMVGCIRFLRGYYFTFVTQRRKIGFIGGNSIYGISATQQLHVSLPEKDNVAIAWINRWLNPSAEEDAEKRYLGLFHFLDLTKDFYFSYSYDITHTLQHNMTTGQSEPSEMFTWNSYLTRELKTCLSGGAVKELVIPLVLGCYEQRKCSIFGRLVSVILLARRSRHFAGTRYLKRGVADTGMVANDVELEQIIEDENMGPGKFSSFVQHRGSIPVFWSQETSPTLPKPPIVLNRVDPTYSSTQKHFADLFTRYGSPIVALNLVKQNEKKEREVIVGNEYMNAVEYINNFMPPEHRVRYVALDYSRLSGPKQKGVNVLHSLDKVAVWALGQTGVFCSAPKRRMNLSNGKQGIGGVSSPFRSPEPASSLPVLGDLDAVSEISAEQPPPLTAISKHSGEWLEQRGVLRTNCIDCLDRTNVSQFSVGMRALGQQLYVMGIRNTPLLESRSQLVMVLMKLYSLVGDAISMQYGGSEAHKNVKNSAARENVKHRELLTSIRRYYSNSFTDTLKQDAINIFLGHFVPKENEPPLWELESDYYLHNFEVLNGKMAVEKVRKYLEFHAESKKRVFGEDYGVPMQLACCAPQQTTEDEDEDEFIDDEFEYYREVILQRDREKRDEYINECRRVMEEWWKEPIESFDRRKCVPPACGVAQDTKAQRPGEEDKSGTLYAVNALQTPGTRSGLKGLGPLYSDEFLHMYHPDEITTFEKVLGYKFMNPIELSDESESATKRRTDSAVVAHLTSAPSSSSIAALAPVDEESFSELDTSPIRRPVAKVPTRSYRSMSAPDFGEELERADSLRKGRDSSHEFKMSESEEFLSISGVDSRHASRAALAASSSISRLHGGVPLKAGGLRKDDPISIERFAQGKSHKKFIGDCTSAPPDPIYDRYTHMKESPQVWESDNQGAKMYFEAYLRENNISPDDARGLREAQSRGGATFKIQTGPYTGLDQNIKARVLVAKKLKTDAEDRKIFEDSLDYNKLVQTTAKSFPSESLELYKSFFDDDLPEVKLYGGQKKAANSRFSSSQTMPSTTTSEEVSDVLKTLSLQPAARKSGGQLRDSELIPVGPLFKMDGGKDCDYILFNTAAADRAFGEVLRNETALSFYSK